MLLVSVLQNCYVKYTWYLLLSAIVDSQVSYRLYKSKIKKVLCLFSFFLMVMEIWFFLISYVIWGKEELCLTKVTNFTSSYSEPAWPCAYLGGRDSLPGYGRVYKFNFKVFCCFRFLGFFFFIIFVCLFQFGLVWGFLLSFCFVCLFVG